MICKRGGTISHSAMRVGRAIQHLANLGIITVQGDSVYEITPLGTSAAEPQSMR